jgi:hypothetical protein
VISGILAARADVSFGAGNSMVDISGKGNYPPIILEGDPVHKGELNANRSAANDGRVLYIGNNKVTLGDNLTLTGGYTLWGGAVLVGTHGSDSAGEFIMAGGNISGNTAYSGGGVMVYKGHMSMTGGIIQNNDNYGNGFGGGVYVHDDGTSFSMNNGIIRGNGGTGTDNGGGVYVNGNGIFTMTGGEILNNTSAAKGGGVYVAGYGDFTMSGGTISGNTSVEGGGVCVSKYSAVFNKTGGTVSGNTPN